MGVRQRRRRNGPLSETRITRSVEELLTDIISGELIQAIPCRMTKPKALRTLVACKRCKFHGGIEELRPPGQLKSKVMPNGLPPSYLVICSLPTKEVVVDLIMEEADGSDL